MTTETILRTFTMVDMECGECGIPFRVPDYFQRERRQDKRGWYCPNGHCRVYRESDADRLKRELEDQKKAVERERNNVAYWRDEYARMDRRRAAAKGQLTKVLNRVKAGLCPHCSAYSSDLEDHMRQQHPDATEEILGNYQVDTPKTIGDTVEHEHRAEAQG